MMPSIFGENLFDDWFDFPFDRSLRNSRNALYGKHEKNLMKTDIRDTGSTYELDIDLPGFHKDEIKAKVENGYLTISAEKGLNKEEKDHEGEYIRRERYVGQCARSFYIGEGVSQNDIQAKFEDGILKLSIPKQDPKKLEETKYIAIEG